MASPRIIIQILITGTQIFGKALFEASKQAVKNARNGPQGVLGSDVAGLNDATSSSITDQLTRQHRMTLDEAHLILNVKRGDGMDVIMKQYEHLFKANSPSPAPAKATTGGKQAAPPSHSHYLQSKVVRARERLEAEVSVATEGSETRGATTPSGSSSSDPPRPPDT